jgi:hypothetical protein
MPFINYSAKEINCTVGYFGPAVAGRLRSLEQIHKVQRPEGRSRIISVGNDSGQMKQFDFLADDIGTLRSLAFRAHLYCSDYEGIDAAEHALLKRIDGILFVASSDPHRMAANVASLQILKTTLGELRWGPVEPVFAMQYHADCTESLSMEAMNIQLNADGHPAFASADDTPKGARDALKNVLQRIRKQAMP